MGSLQSHTGSRHSPKGTLHTLVWTLWSHGDLAQPTGTSHTFGGFAKNLSKRALAPTQAKALTQGQLFPFLLLSHESEPCFGSPQSLVGGKWDPRARAMAWSCSLVL